MSRHFKLDQLFISVSSCFSKATRIFGKNSDKNKSFYLIKDSVKLKKNY